VSRFGADLLYANRKVLPPSSWRQTNVHRTFVLNHSNLSAQKKKPERANALSGFFLLWGDSKISMQSFGEALLAANLMAATPY
jgi:hypothetical protein